MPTRPVGCFYDRTLILLQIGSILAQGEKEKRNLSGAIIYLPSFVCCCLFSWIKFWQGASYNVFKHPSSFDPSFFCCLLFVHWTEKALSAMKSVWSLTMDPIKQQVSLAERSVRTMKLERTLEIRCSVLGSSMYLLCIWASSYTTVHLFWNSSLVTHYKINYSLLFKSQS